MRFQDKVVFITGAASGIGAATAGLFAEEGAKVVGVDIAGDGTDILRCDVTDPASVEAAVGEAVSRHGGLDVVLNIAGVLHMAPFSAITFDVWQRVLSVNLNGPYLVSHAAMPHLVERQGCIVNVASISGLQGQPYNAAYCASKGGVVQLTRALAVEYANVGVRVNCVCPGGVDTPMTQSGVALAGMAGADINPQAMARLTGLMEGWIDPREIGEAMAYLASDAAKSVSGTALVIDRVVLAS